MVCVKVISKNSEQQLSFKSPWDVGLINETFSNVSTVVGFNLKFDLAWVRREFGIEFDSRTRYYDCQYAEYLFSNQTWSYPDLDTACQKRNLAKKFDYIYEKYWKVGIETDLIPPEELEEYCIQDVEITHQLYLEQLKLFANSQNGKLKLFNLHMWDLPVLLEMEWNGLKYNKEKSLELSKEYDEAVRSVELRLNTIFDCEVNWGSYQQKSAVLYGGKIQKTTYVPIGVFKTGSREGQVKTKKIDVFVEFPRLIEPLKGSETATAGIFSTDEATLRSLKTNKKGKQIIELILERQKLEKMNGTYLKGLPAKMEESNWGEYLHPQYTQCKTITGRVASSKPNGQNIPPVGKQLIETRF